MEFRAYHDKDWEEVCELYLRAKPYELRGSCDLKAMKPLNEDEHMTWLFVNSKVTVAVEDGYIVAFYGLQDKELTFVFVHPDYFRRGIGNAMIDRVIEEIGGGLWIKVTSNNFRAISLYEQKGFKITKEYESVYNGYAISLKEMTL